MDEKEFKSHSFQRAIQYLKRTIEGAPLDHFSCTGAIEGTPKQGLKILLRYKLLAGNFLMKVIGMFFFVVNVECGIHHGLS